MTTAPSLLIDAELYLYRAAAANEYEAEWAENDWTYFCRHDDAKATFQDDVMAAVETFPDHQVVLATGDRASFRYGIFPGYKSNRKKTRKPAGYAQLLAWLRTVSAVRGWTVAQLPDVEADDVLGILYEPGDVIMSFDKDMLTLPGLHFRNGEVLEVSDYEADLAFFTQALTGDTADGYPGCPGLGPVKAGRILSSARTAGQMWQAVVEAYRKEKLSEATALQQARCARILRNGEYDHDQQVPIMWTPPVQ
jgi:DNA polymerase-1